MEVNIPPSYIAYLYGQMFASPSLFGHKHVVTGKRLNPIELRKAIKKAMLVSLYNDGTIDFEIRIKKGRFRERRELFIKALKNVESSDFSFENDLFTLLKQHGETIISFLHAGFDYEKKLLDRLANVMNKELAREGYLKEEEGRYTRARARYTPNVEAIEPLRNIALEIKLKTAEFEAKRKDLTKILDANL